MPYKSIATILILVLIFVLSKSEFRYRFGNDLPVTASFLPYSVRVASSDLPDQRLRRPYASIFRSKVYAFI